MDRKRSKVRVDTREIAREAKKDKYLHAVQTMVEKHFNRLRAQERKEQDEKKVLRRCVYACVTEALRGMHL